MARIDTGTEELLCDIHQRVAVVTLNKPHKKNALGDILTPALRALLPELEGRADVGCVMLTGAGKSFCSGGDVSEMGGDTHSSDPAPSLERRIADLTQKQRALTGRLYHLSKPTVAALPGAAAGAGLSIALACDLRVAADDAFLITAFRNVGLSGDYGATWFLPRLVGLARAKSLFYFSPRLSAQEALAIGLVDRVFPAASFREQALQYAIEIANGPTRTLGRIKQNLQAGLVQSLDDSFALEARNMVESGGGDETRAAILAFKEKRNPVFHPQNRPPTGENS
ncbi:MAG: enoyl-CoA hydratase-related protein [Pseudomonadales bacterium]|nr:enoyl-CoA hydratase/isomerase family protein [Pseudomonadales bacterium]